MNLLRRIAPPLLTLGLVVLALVFGSQAWIYYTRSPWTRDARVRADVVTLAAEVAGRIVELHVQDNQRVKKGDLLLRIDPQTYELALQRAERAVTVAKAALGQSQATIAANQALLRLRQSEEQRRRTLKERSAISAEEWQRSSTDVAVAQAQLVREQASLGLVEAQVQLAESAYNQAALDLQRTRVYAPVNGFVTNLLTRSGDYARGGEPLLAVVDSDSFYVSGYFEETKLPRIHEGDPVRIELMSGERLKGRVDSIANAITDRENAPGSRLLANINPSYTWVKLAQRIPVRIAFDPGSTDKIRLRAGVTATVSVIEDARKP